MIVNPDKKEFKYNQCFKSKNQGSCNWCKYRTWNVGNKIYGMKKNDGKWAACSDRQCYLEQGGTLTLFKRNDITTVKPVEPKKEPVKIPSEMKSDHDLILMLLAKVSILENVVGGLVKK